MESRILKKGVKMLNQGETHDKCKKYQAVNTNDNSLIESKYFSFYNTHPLRAEIVQSNIGKSNPLRWNPDWNQEIDSIPQKQ